MNFLTLDAVQTGLFQRYQEKAAKFPDHFAEFIPRPAKASQAAEVNAAVQTLTGIGCPPDFYSLVSFWDLTNLNVAGFSFGFEGSFADRLLESNRSDALNPWWEGGMDKRPLTWLFIAQGDPYVLVLDVQTEDVLAYVASEGAQSSRVIAHKMTDCLRMLATLQLHSANEKSLALNEVRDVLGQDVDDQFWAEQIRHWQEVN